MIARLAAVLALGFAVSCIDPTAGDGPLSASSYEPVTLTADVAPSEGRETIRASVSEVTILDARGAVIASAAAFDPQGSADEVVGVRVFPQAYVGAPLVAITTTVGGHRESTTYTALYRVQSRQVETLFVGATEEVVDESVATGSLLVLPATLLYRAPRAELATVLSFDETSRRYVAR